MELKKYSVLFIVLVAGFFACALPQNDTATDESPDSVFGLQANNDWFPFTSNGYECRLYTSRENFSTAASICKTFDEPGSTFYNERKEFVAAVHAGLAEFVRVNGDKNGNFSDGVWTPNFHDSKTHLGYAITHLGMKGYAKDCETKRPFVCHRDSSAKTDVFNFTENGDEYRLYLSRESFSTAKSMCDTLGGPQPISTYVHQNGEVVAAIQRGMKEFLKGNSVKNRNLSDGVWTPNYRYSVQGTRCIKTLLETERLTRQCDKKRPFVCQRGQLCFPGKDKSYTVVSNNHLFFVGTLIEKTKNKSMEYCQSMGWTLASTDKIYKPVKTDFGCLVSKQKAWVFNPEAKEHYTMPLNDVATLFVERSFTRKYTTICQKECGKLTCKHGGTVEKCRCRCPNGYSGVTCACKHGGCQNGGLLDEATCKCVCPTWYVGEFCGCKGLICGKGEYINEKKCTCDSITTRP